VCKFDWISFTSGAQIRRWIQGIGNQEHIAMWAFEYKRTVLNPITAIKIKALVRFGSLGQMNMPANNAIAIMDFS
jgi:hypothetical protein